MSALVAMFIGYTIVLGGLFLYVLRIHRVSRSIERELREVPGRRT